jgi:chemotaxis signal transduction protein
MGIGKVDNEVMILLDCQNILDDDDIVDLKKAA